MLGSEALCGEVHSILRPQGGDITQIPDVCLAQSPAPLAASGIHFLDVWGQLSLTFFKITFHLKN